MRKLRLDVSGLTVESFPTNAGAAANGTVRGNDATDAAATCMTFCCTCQATCPITHCHLPGTSCIAPLSDDTTV